MINRGIPTAWPDSVLSATRGFRQGHLLESPPLIYVASAAHAVWELTRATGDPALEDEVFELDSQDRAPYGLITTQTCDINEAKPRHPWIHVAPVYRREEGDLAAMVEQQRVSYLVPLTPPTLDGPWVVDLRLEVPVEKGWLVGREPMESCASEAEYEVLAQRLGAKRDRPAFADSLVLGVYNPLKTWLEKRAGKDASAGVTEIRLRIGGTRLAPYAASLVLIKDVEWTEGETSAWDGWWDKAHPVAANHGIDLLSNEYQMFQSMSARQYLDSIPINLGYLSG